MTEMVPAPLRAPTARPVTPALTRKPCTSSTPGPGTEHRPDDRPPPGPPRGLISREHTPMYLNSLVRSGPSGAPGWSKRYGHLLPRPATSEKEPPK
ncbi:hypothetical protein P3T39_006885 [Kitasatospora sp. GP82]|nr:hypothetical protein [Kitasatospora sp. GP82]